MTEGLAGLRIAFLVANEGVERVELTEPWQAITDAGATPVLLAPEAGEVRSLDHLDASETFQADQAVGDADPATFDGLVLPGGVANPDQLRTMAPVLDFVGAMSRAGTPFAAVCHAPWTLIEADLVRGRTLTSWPSLQTDVRNAGGTWVDREVVVCSEGPNVLVTSRQPKDLAAFCEKTVEQFSLART